VFTKPINSTPLTGEIADRLFLNITALFGNLDESFTATLRAVLRNRVPKGESVRLICRGLNYSEDEIMSVTPAQSANWFIPEELRQMPGSSHRIFIIYNNSDAGEKMLEVVRENVGGNSRYLSGYILQEDLRIFYARKLSALFYHNAAYRTTVIYTPHLDYKQFHALQMMIPKYLPTLFKNNPLSETETALLKSLGNKSAVEYETLITEFTKDLDIRSEIIRTKLAGFETAFELIRVNELKNQINLHKNDYDNHLYSMRDISAKIRNCQYTLAGLECAIAEHSGDSELIEYFLCNKSISLIRVIGTSIEFIVNSYADIYDADAFEQYVGNHNGYMYSNLNPNVTKSQMEILYRAIFGDGRYKLRMCAAFNADMKTGLKTIQHYTFPPESVSYIPNPHIQHYGCIGDYAGRFHEYMSKRDYVGAIDQAVVSAKNLNFYDSTVIAAFAEDLSYSGLSCIERPDGTLLTPMEAIRELEGGAV
jgi:hypothetical protein